MRATDGTKRRARAEHFGGYMVTSIYAHEAIRCSTLLLCAGKVAPTVLRHADEVCWPGEIEELIARGPSVSVEAVQRFMKKKALGHSRKSTRQDDWRQLLKSISGISGVRWVSVRSRRARLFSFGCANMG